MLSAADRRGGADGRRRSDGGVEGARPRRRAPAGGAGRESRSAAPPALRPSRPRRQTREKSVGGIVGCPRAGVVQIALAIVGPTANRMIDLDQMKHVRRNVWSDNAHTKLEGFVSSRGFHRCDDLKGLRAKCRTLRFVRDGLAFLDFPLILSDQQGQYNRCFGCVSTGCCEDSACFLSWRVIGEHSFRLERQKHLCSAKMISPVIKRPA
jgi:hypothetical protein